MAEERSQKTEDRGISLKNFEIVAGFIWMHLEAFQAHMQVLKLGPEGNFELFATFLELNYEDFQIYLEVEHEIEGTEAERFLDELREQK